MNVQAPDLSVYNLTNAAEKLEVERLAGMYKYPSFSPDQQLKLDLLYNEKLYAVKQGVDTYWLAQPVSVGVGQRHSLDLEGGDKYTTYALSFGYDDKKGVMKGSDRTAYDINSRLQYNWKSLTFRNQLRVQIIDSNESPYGSFNQYALLNPYYKMKDENGNILPQLGTEFAAYKTGQVHQNPVYEATAINNKSFGKSTLINDNFTINWAISENLRLKGSIGYTRTEGKNHWFKSPDSYSFASLPVEERGRYTISSNTSSRYETSAVLSYYKNMDNHLLNIVLGGNLNQSIFESSAFTGIGFTHDRLDYISWASS